MVGDYYIDRPAKPGDDTVVNFDVNRRTLWASNAVGFAVIRILRCGAELPSALQGPSRFHRSTRRSRRVAPHRGCGPASRDRRHHRGRGRHGGLSGAAVRPPQRLSAGLSHRVERRDESATGSARTWHRPDVAPARCPEGMDGEAPGLVAAQAGRNRQPAVHGKFAGRGQS
jgi:hypothetical protein